MGKTTEQLKYRDILLKSEKEIEEDEIQYKLEQAELDVKSVISETRKELLKKRKQLQKLLLESPFNYNEYSDVEEEVFSLQAGIEKAEKFLKEKF